jgi:3-hydroxybutyryl-CoA dehydratase
MKITREAIAAFAQLTGDHNPIHKGNDLIAHGALIFGYLSAAIWKHWGDGAIIIRQDINFLRPVKENNELSITFNHVSSLRKINHATFLCWASGNKLVAHGSLTIKLNNTADPEYLPPADNQSEVV